MSTPFFGTPLRPRALVALAALGVPSTHALALDYAPLFDPDVRQTVSDDSGVSLWETDLDGKHLTLIDAHGVVAKLLAVDGASAEGGREFVRVVMRPEDAPLHLPRALVLDQIERIEAPSIDARVYAALCAVEAAVRSVRLRRLPRPGTAASPQAAAYLVDVRAPAHAHA